MPSLLSGSTLRRGGSGEFIDLSGAQPQLPASATTLTGFTLVTNSLLQTSYRSSLGFIEFNTASMYSALPEGTIRILATGTQFLSSSTTTGNLVVGGGIGVGGNMYIEEDIVVNGITIGTGWEGQNNIVIRGTAVEPINNFLNGQESIAIGYDTLTGLITANKNIAVGRFALSSGTKIVSSIAIGDSALKSSGLIDGEIVGNISAINVIPSSAISNVAATNPAIVTAVGHGLTTGNQIYITGVTGVTLGLNSLVNQQSLFVSVLTPDTFEVYYNKTLSLPVNATIALPYSTGGIVYSPIKLTINDASLTTGSYVYIANVEGMVQLNDFNYYIDPVDPTTFALYFDSTLTIPVDGTNYTAYTSNGTLTRVFNRTGNIAYGNDAGKNLIDGNQNIFIGNQAGSVMSTGSNNIIIGHSTAQYVYTGTGIISIGGDNLVSGKNDQVNIGSVFYYDGDGYAALNAETTLGLGTTAEILTTGTFTQASTLSGALVVIGGAAILDNLIVGSTFNIVGESTSSIHGPLAFNTVTVRSANPLTLNVESTAGYVTQVVGNLYLNSGEVSSSTTNGSLVVTGGVGIVGDIYIGGQLVVKGNESADISPAGADVFIKPTLGGVLEIYPNGGGSIDNVEIGQLNPANGTFDTVTVVGTGISTSTTTGALTVVGGVGIQGDVYARTGHVDENYLLYTPRVFVTAGILPVDPRIGDFWIDSTIPAYMQYIKDGANTFWIQVGAV